MKPAQTKNLKEGYISGLMQLAGEMARKDMAIVAQPEHLVGAIIEHLASAYVFNLHVSEKLNSLNAELEALRRAVQNDQKNGSPE